MAKLGEGLIRERSLYTVLLRRRISHSVLGGSLDEIAVVLAWFRLSTCMWQSIIKRELGYLGM